MKKIKAIVFDLDGTLLNTLGDLSENLNRVLSRRGHPTHSQEKYKIMVGRGLRQLTLAATQELSLTDQEFEHLFDEFQKEYRLHPTDHTKPYDEILEMLEAFGEGVQLFVLSNKEHQMTLRVVKQILGHIDFVEIHGMKPGVPGKPDPTVLKSILSGYNLDPEEVLYLGDSDVDMETALGAGVKACGALWGFRQRDELIASGAQELFESPGKFMDYAINSIKK